MNGEAAQLLKRFTDSLAAWWWPLELLAYLIGFVLVVLGVVGLKDRRSSQFGAGAVCGKIVVGICLFNLPGFLDSLSMSYLQTESFNALGYVAPGSGPGQMYITATVHIVALLGMISCIRGLVLLRGVSQDPRSFGAGVTHLIGGSAAINMVPLLRVFGRTLGGYIETVVNNLIG